MGVAPDAVRLQKYLARAGVASRRASEELICAGRVTVNGDVCCELGSKVAPGDEVRVDGRIVCPPNEAVTLMLHKPAGYVTTMSDPQGRPCVADLVPADRFPGLFPVGRLDRDTTGLLLFSTDGRLGADLLHPRTHVMKHYLALVEGSLGARAADRLRAGVQLGDGMTLPARIEVLSGQEESKARAAMGLGGADASGGCRSGRDMSGVKGTRCRGTSVVRVGIREGRKREVRRMLKAVGCPVLALHRTDFGPLSLDGLARGAWRELTAEEVAALRCAIAGNC